MTFAGENEKRGKRRKLKKGNKMEIIQKKILNK
jgi:hypothetical protein